MAVNLMSLRLSTETRLLQVCEPTFLLLKNEVMTFTNHEMTHRPSVLAQDSQESSVTPSESSATTASCSPSRPKR